jgi:ribosome-binding ATPase
LLIVLNVGESAAAAPLPPAVQQRLDRDGLAGLSLCAQIEMEIAALAPEERGAFLIDLGLDNPARDRFIRAAYNLLNLVSFFTTGEDDVHAWPIRRGTVAVKAAGKVHTDMERGFIRAEVIAYDDFVRYGSEAKCREAGKLRLEGKDYVFQDGDILHFRFNV